MLRLRLEISGHVRSPHINTQAQPSEHTGPEFTVGWLLARIRFSWLCVALDCIDVRLSHKNMTVALLVLRHVQGDLYVTLPVECESHTKG